MPIWILSSLEQGVASIGVITNIAIGLLAFAAYLLVVSSLLFVSPFRLLFLDKRTNLRWKK